MPQGQPVSVPEDGLTTRQRRNRPLLVVHTGEMKGKSTAAFVVVDCESGPVRLGLAQALAQHLDGVALRLEELSAQALTSIAKVA